MAICGFYRSMTKNGRAFLDVYVSPFHYPPSPLYKRNSHDPSDPSTRNKNRTSKRRRIAHPCLNTFSLSAALDEMPSYVDQSLFIDRVRREGEVEGGWVGRPLDVEGLPGALPGPGTLGGRGQDSDMPYALVSESTTGPDPASAVSVLPEVGTAAPHREDRGFRLTDATEEESDEKNSEGDILDFIQATQRV